MMMMMMTTMMVINIIPKTSKTCRSLVGRDSAVGIATRYGLDGPRIESW
jgi:hypothetical protein